MFTPSHEALYTHYFLPSIPASDEFELVTGKLEQPGDGTYLNNDFLNAIEFKVSLILRALEENPDEYFVWSDCDIQFFRPIKADLLAHVAGYDIAAQSQGPKDLMCAGFFICHSNPRTRALFKKIHENWRQHRCDQHTLNLFRDSVRWKLLPKQYSHVYFMIGGLWKGQAFDINRENMSMFHACWTVGMANKLKLMQIINDSPASLDLNGEPGLSIRAQTEAFRFPLNVTYPPHHQGPYLEEFFDRYFNQEEIQEEFQDCPIEYLPVYWTSLYVHRDMSRPTPAGLTGILKGLDPEKHYFTVVQYADGVKHPLPPNTTIFAAGGGNFKGIPLPLLCYPHAYKPEIKKDIFCSFVGSKTHWCRQKLLEILGKDTTGRYIIHLDDWQPNVSKGRVDKFQDLLHRSVFSLCPRGYGPTSFRLYEAMEVGSIPVYLYDTPWLPYRAELNWNDICVMIPLNKMDQLQSILEAITPEQIERYRQNINAYRSYFTLEGMSRWIIDKLKWEATQLKRKKKDTAYFPSESRRL